MHAFGPRLDLIVHNVNAFESLLQLLQLLVHLGQVLVHLNDFSVVGVSRFAALVVMISLVDLKFVEALIKFFVLFLEFVNLGVGGRNGLEQGGVSLFALSESLHHSLHVSDLRGCFDLLESVVNCLGVGHLLGHLALHKRIPQFVNVQVVAHLQLGRVFAFVGRILSNLLILLLPLNAPLNRLLLVCNALLQFQDSILPILLLLFDILHQVVKGVFGLEMDLLCFTLLLLFNLEDALLGVQTLVEFSYFQFGSDEVFLHAVEHVSVRALSHSLFVDLVHRGRVLVSQLLQPRLVLVHRPFKLRFLRIQSLNLFKQFLVLQLFVCGKFLGLVVLLLNLT